MLNGWIGRGPLRAPGTLLTMSDIPSEASEATLKSIRGGLTLPGGLPGINSVPDRCGVLSCAGYYSCNCLRGQEPCSRSTQGALRSVCCQRVRASERGRGLPVCLLACLQVSPHHPLATTDNPVATPPSTPPSPRPSTHTDVSHPPLPQASTPAAAVIPPYPPPARHHHHQPPAPAAHHLPPHTPPAPIPPPPPAPTTTTYHPPPRPSTLRRRRNPKQRRPPLAPSRPRLQPPQRPLEIIWPLGNLKLKN